MVRLVNHACRVRRLGMTRHNFHRRRNPKAKLGYAGALAVFIFLVGGLTNSFGAALHRSDSKLCAFALNGMINRG